MPFHQNDFGGKVGVYSLVSSVSDQLKIEVISQNVMSFFEYSCGGFDFVNRFSE